MADKNYCEHHFEFVKHLGSTERALQEIDGNIKKLFSLIEKRRDTDMTQDKAISSLSGFVKAYGLAVIQLIALISIALKIWRG